MKIRIPFASLLLAVVAMTTLGAACSDSKPTTPTNAPRANEPAKTPLVQKTEIADWCPEHGVPESICTRCNSSLVAGFKAKGDWCKEHSLPESQCFTCHPDLEAKFAAMAPKKGG